MTMERINTVLMIDSFRKMWLSCEFQWLRQTVENVGGLGDLDPDSDLLCG
jgi:hypothetical protein